VADCFLATAGFVRRLVRTAFCAESERSAAVRFLALARACLESAADDTTRWPSPCSFFFIPRERAGFGACAGCFPRSMSRAAWCRVCAEVVPFRGGGSFTPARLALESPMAMACSVERAPCFPARMCSISSRTNSPACVDTDLPCRLSVRARASVSLSGMMARSTLGRVFGAASRSSGTCTRERSRGRVHLLGALVHQFRMAGGEFGLGQEAVAV
jgi:hypothetical protein